VPERGALSFSLVFLWAYKEKVTRQQAKPKRAINTILFGVAMFLFRPAGRNRNPKPTPTSFKIPRSNLRIVCYFAYRRNRKAQLIPIFSVLSCSYFALLGELLIFACPKISNQQKGHPLYWPTASLRCSILKRGCGTRRCAPQTVLALVLSKSALLVSTEGKVRASDPANKVINHKH
jgi:hypothetical protein